MKRGARVLFTALLVPAAGAMLLGCPKKVSTTGAGPESRLTEKAVATRPDAKALPGAGDLSGPKAGGGGAQDEQRLAQLLASRGEDIPIKDSPAIEFVEPAAADRDVLKPVYFEYDKSNIRPEYQPVLEGISRWMAAQADRQLLVEGHCDERGTDEYNLALGERRALAVRRYLVALGVAADRVHTISYGEEKPADPASTEAAWSRNRRAEFKVSAR
jgi:peptidoglycan-associated lipoprotein